VSLALSLALRVRLGYLRNVKDIADVAVGTTASGTPIRIADVAPVQIGLATPTRLTPLVIPAMFLIWKSNVINRRSDEVRSEG
jgi:Cu/Ag efflux pump CusA